MGRGMSEQVAFDPGWEYGRVGTAIVNVLSKDMRGRAIENMCGQCSAPLEPVGHAGLEPTGRWRCPRCGTCWEMEWEGGDD